MNTISVCPFDKHGDNCDLPCDVTQCGNRGCSEVGTGCHGYCFAGWKDASNKCKTGKHSVHGTYVQYSNKVTLKY